MANYHHHHLAKFSISVDFYNSFSLQIPFSIPLGFLLLQTFKICPSIPFLPATAGSRLPPEDTDISQARAVDLISDDDRSIAADSWSIKSDYGSTLDDDQRHADASEALSAAAIYRAASDYRLP